MGGSVRVGVRELCAAFYCMKKVIVKESLLWFDWSFKSTRLQAN